MRRESVYRVFLRRGLEQAGHVLLKFRNALFQKVYLRLLEGEGLVELGEELFLKIVLLFKAGYLFFESCPLVRNFFIQFSFY